MPGGSQVVSSVGKVEALVGQGKVRDDRVCQGDGQRWPGEKRRIDDLHLHSGLALSGTVPSLDTPAGMPRLIWEWILALAWPNVPLRRIM